MSGSIRGDRWAAVADAQFGRTRCRVAHWQSPAAWRRQPSPHRLRSCTRRTSRSCSRTQWPRPQGRDRRHGPCHGLARRPRPVLRVSQPNLSTTIGWCFGALASVPGLTVPPARSVRPSGEFVLSGLVFDPVLALALVFAPSGRVFRLEIFIAGRPIGQCRSGRGIRVGDIDERAS